MGLLEDIISFLVDIGIPLAIIVIIYAAFLFMTASGNEEKIKKAKKALLWAIVGAAVLIIGKGFITFVQDILGGSSGG